MYLVFRMQFEHEDGGTVHDVRIRILDEDANQLTEVKGKISAPEAIAPGGFRTQNTIFELNGFVFPKFGRYVFELKADDESVVEVSLEVAAA
ncbi:MAG: hypothetical protein H3C62_16720 [Gemmatimonadaceae bacterium]|nr:hypothetical protein [Gemmatimonadaceae bacterium]